MRLSGSLRTVAFAVLSVVVASLGNDSWRAAAQGGIVRTKMTSEALQDKLNLGWGTTGGNTGVMMVPYSDMAKGDFPEQMLFLSSGQMRTVNRVYAPSDGQDLFRKLEALQRMGGKTVDMLVVAGHAAEGQVGVFFGNGASLTPQDVDVFDQIAALENQVPPPPQLQRLYEKARTVVGFKDLFVPGAMLVILNCDAAETAAGRAFVEKLARLTVGSKGGSVVVSDRVVEIRQQHLNESRFIGPPATQDQLVIFEPSRTRTELLVGGTAAPDWIRLEVAPGSYPAIPKSLAAQLNQPTNNAPTFVTNSRTGAGGPTLALGIPNVAGTWRRRDWKETFGVTQIGNTMTWDFTYPWLTLPQTRREVATGTISGSCNQGRVDITIAYTTPDNREPPHEARYTGSITCDNAGNAVSIRWNNNSVQDRVLP